MNWRYGLAIESGVALAAIFLVLIQHTPLGIGSTRATDFLSGLASGLSLVAIAGWLLYAFSESGGGKKA
jgi:hypothetical protein